MKKITCLVFLLTFGSIVFFISPAKATLVHTDAQATMTSGDPAAVVYLPIATVVTASIDFDISSGTPSEAQITSVSGTFTWNDGFSRVFNVSSGHVDNYGSNGSYEMLFNGTGPTIGGYTPSHFYIKYDLGFNLFTTTDELSDLFLGGTITKYRIGVQNNVETFYYGTLETDVSGSVTPEPATFCLLGLGGLMLRRKRGR
jgi:hypothetical protein